jgi:hypothetical protein
MKIRWVRGGVAAFFLLYLLAVIWPLGTLFAGAEPFVLGLPFSLFWPVLWIIMGAAVLALLDRAEDVERTRHEGGSDSGGDAP